MPELLNLWWLLAATLCDDYKLGGCVCMRMRETDRQCMVVVLSEKMTIMLCSFMPKPPQIDLAGLFLCLLRWEQVFLCHFLAPHNSRSAHLCQAWWRPGLLSVSHLHMRAHTHRVGAHPYLSQAEWMLWGRRGCHTTPGQLNPLPLIPSHQHILNSREETRARTHPGCTPDSVKERS